jgi:copper chaperone CopZ
MKNIIIFCLFILAFFNCSGDQTKEPKNQKEVNIKVSGMTCSSCEKSIIHSLEKLEGVYRVHASHKTKSVTVHYDADKTNEQTIKNEINQSGYIVEDT